MLNVDLWFNQLMHGIQNQTLTNFFLFITNIGSAWVIVPLSIALVLYLFYKDERSKAILTGTTIFLAATLCELLKIMVGRSRPSNALTSEIITQSFPSWHAMMSLLFFLILIFLYKDEIRNKLKRNTFTSACIALIILISFSRLYLNVHWLTDVIAGLILGTIFALIFRKLKK